MCCACFIYDAGMMPPGMSALQNVPPAVVFTPPVSKNVWLTIHVSEPVF